MTNTAQSAGEADQGEPDIKGEPRSVPAIAKRVSTDSPKARSKRPRSKQAAASARPASKKASASVERRREPRALAELAPSPPPRAMSQFGTLLVGAGIGAAVTLSVVAFGTKRGRGSALAVAATKSVTYAIARTTANGSWLNLVARAVGSAIA